MKEEEKSNIQNINKSIQMNNSKDSIINNISQRQIEIKKNESFQIPRKKKTMASTPNTPRVHKRTISKEKQEELFTQLYNDSKTRKDKIRKLSLEKEKKFNSIYTFTPVIYTRQNNISTEGNFIERLSTYEKQKSRKMQQIKKEIELNTPKPITSNKKLYMRWEMNRKTLNETLASLIPEVIDSDIKLPMQLNNSSAVLTWSSSNEEVFSNYGKVTRLTQDVEIEISVRVETESYVYNLSFKTKIAKIDLKPLNYGSIVSGYLYDSGSFKGLTDSATQQLDIINYSFAQISSGKLYISGSMDTEKILSYREKGVRIVLAIGGWASGGFSTAMRTESSRKVLIDSIMEALKKYQFDGTQ